MRNDMFYVENISWFLDRFCANVEVMKLTGLPTDVDIIFSKWNFQQILIHNLFDDRGCSIKQGDSSWSKVLLQTSRSTPCNMSSKYIFYEFQSAMVTINSLMIT